MPERNLSFLHNLHFSFLPAQQNQLPRLLPKRETLPGQLICARIPRVTATCVKNGASVFIRAYTADEFPRGNRNRNKPPPPVFLLNIFKKLKLYSALFLQPSIYQSPYHKKPQPTLFLLPA